MLKMNDVSLQRSGTMKLVFCTIGIHLFGPMSVKQRENRLKRWDPLFTCFKTCAICLQVVEVLDDYSFKKQSTKIHESKGKDRRN